MIIWADSVELGETRTGQDVEQLVRRIAVAALPSLQDDLLRNLPPQPDDAYDVYFLNKLRMRSQDSLEAARALAASWEELIALHPNFTAAYPPLIRLYNTDYCYTGLGSCGCALWGSISGGYGGSGSWADTAGNPGDSSDRLCGCLGGCCWCGEGGGGGGAGRIRINSDATCAGCEEAVVSPSASFGDITLL